MIFMDHLLSRFHKSFSANPANRLSLSGDCGNKEHPAPQQSATMHWCDRTISWHFAGHNTVAFYKLFNEPATCRGQAGHPGL